MTESILQRQQRACPWLLASVALVSCGALALEILLTRMFAVVHSHHFAYMMISLALLGFGVSGSSLTLARRWLLEYFPQSFIVNLLLFALLVIASPLWAKGLPFHPEELLWDRWQPLWLAGTYLFLAAPFFCAANAIGLALIAFQSDTGRIYAADLAGAGLGSVFILGLLYVEFPEQAIRLIATLGCLSAIIAVIGLRGWATGWVVVTVSVTVLLALVPSEWLRPEPGAYKSLNQALQVSGTRIIADRASPLGRVTVVESPIVPLRYAAGLSLTSVSEPPAQLGLFTDGDNMDAITRADSTAERLAFLHETTAALAYQLATPTSVFVLGAGGGLEILRALEHDAKQVDAAEINPQIANLLHRDFRNYSGRLLERPGVTLRVGDGRGMLAAGNRRYDLIQMSLLGSLGVGGTIGGLSEDYLHTVEAIREYLAHLNPQGFLSMTRWIQVPPRDGLKLLATALTAFDDMGVADAKERLVMIRSWQTVTLLIKNGRVTDGDIAKTKAFCDKSAFDIAWHPGMQRADANRYNELAEPWFYDGTVALSGPERTHFISAYPFDIRPATDDRPYFHNFFRWRSFVAAWQSKGRGGLALLEAGYLVLSATVIQALVAGSVLILLPLYALRRRYPSSAAPSWRVLVYFTSIGLAFLFIEIAFLQKLLRLVHHPTVALAIVLATFLIAAGAGSAWASLTRPGRESQRRVIVAVAGILLLGTLYSLTFDQFIATVSGWPLGQKALAAGALLAPLAFCLGAPFPLALREIAPPLVPWAWGINGCASVVSAALATLLAVDLGFRAVLWLALALYVIAGAAFPRRWISE
jgi:spermidine synthase